MGDNMPIISTKTTVTKGAARVHSKFATGVAQTGQEAILFSSSANASGYGFGRTRRGGAIPNDVSVEAGTFTVVPLLSVAWKQYVEHYDSTLSKTVEHHEVSCGFTSFHHFRKVNRLASCRYPTCSACQTTSSSRKSVLVQISRRTILHSVASSGSSRRRKCVQSL